MSPFHLLRNDARLIEIATHTIDKFTHNVELLRMCIVLMHGLSSSPRRDTLKHWITLVRQIVITTTDVSVKIVGAIFLNAMAVKTQTHNT
jgi:hypothetical protein